MALYNYELYFLYSSSALPRSLASWILFNQLRYKIIKKITVSPFPCHTIPRIFYHVISSSWPISLHLITTSYCLHTSMYIFSLNHWPLNKGTVIILTLSYKTTQFLWIVFLTSTKKPLLQLFFQLYYRRLFFILYLVQAILLSPCSFKQACPFAQFIYTLIVQWTGFLLKRCRFTHNSAQRSLCCALLDAVQSSHCLLVSGVYGTKKNTQTCFTTLSITINFIFLVILYPSFCVHTPN